MEQYHAGTKTNTQMRTTAITIFAALALSASAQVTRDNQGNYHEATPDSTTANTFTDAQGHVEPVYTTANGKAYVARTSKSGKYYRRYLRIEGEEPKNEAHK